MGKLIVLPGVELNPPTRLELVAEASEMIMKEVTGVFVEQEFEPKTLGAWHQEVRDYFWRQEIKLDENWDFMAEDVRRWRHHWREQALRFIASRRPR